MVRTNKVARGVTGEKIDFVGELISNVTFNGLTKKLKTVVLKNSNNLFGTDWMEAFQLWNLPISSFCQKLENLNVEAEKLKEDLRIKFPEVFSNGLGRCTKISAKFEIKKDAKPVFKKKRNVPFASIEQINKELIRLEKMGVLSKVEYSEWASPTVYVKKKSNEIRVCADFSTGLNSALQDFHHPLPSPQEIFEKNSTTGKFSQRLT